MGKHSYSVLSIKKIIFEGSEITFLYVRNPIPSEITWKGDWSSICIKWTPALR
jgi:hypothetical protein